MKFLTILLACVAAFVAGIYLGLMRVFWPERER